MSSGVSNALWMVDAGLSYFINSFSGKNQLADSTITTISNLGVPAMVLTVIGLWWSRSNRSQTRFVALGAGLSFLMALALNQVILLFVQRVRPYDVGVTHLLVAPSNDPSFPSDHASAAFAIAFAFLLQGKSWHGRVFAFWAIVVATSRIYVGTHYLGDAVGGVFSALVAAIVVSMVYRETHWINRQLVSLL